MSRRVSLAPLTVEAFAPYGDVLDARGEADKIINAASAAATTTAQPST